MSGYVRWLVACGLAFTLGGAAVWAVRDNCPGQACLLQNGCRPCPPIPEEAIQPQDPSAVPVDGCHNDPLFQTIKKATDRMVGEDLSAAPVSTVANFREPEAVAPPAPLPPLPAAGKSETPEPPLAGPPGFPVPPSPALTPVKFEAPAPTQRAWPPEQPDAKESAPRTFVPPVPEPPPPLPKPAEPPAPVPCPWTVNVKVVSGRSCLEARTEDEVIFTIECDKLDLRMPDGQASASGNVKLTAKGVEGACNQLTLNWRDDRLSLNGNVRLTCTQDGQDTELTAESTQLRLKKLPAKQVFSFWIGYFH